jgi:hypothetical protein
VVIDYDSSHANRFVGAFSTLIGDNLADTAPDFSGPFSTAQNVLLGQGAGALGITAGANGNLVGVDPRLGPLADNGGPTLTHALLAGSPALGAGANPLGLTTDQRGLPRTVFGRPDIGAFEVQTALLQFQVKRLSGPLVVIVFDAQTGRMRGRLQPFPRYRGAAKVRLSDVNGDGVPEIIATRLFHGRLQKRTFDAAALQRLA